jgi:ubiquinone biosynthesis monooxygenase Coq7
MEAQNETMRENGQQSGENEQRVRILRPELRDEHIEMRGRSLSVSDRKKVRRALRTLHTLEIMAVTIYRRQISRQDSALNRDLIAAMANEMTHAQDFQIKLYEYGIRPGLFRWAWWMAGFAFGFGSRLLGTKAILKTGIWVETKAVTHYAELLQAAPWDAATRSVIQKDQSDENGHIQTWRYWLNEFQQADAKRRS